MIQQLEEYKNNFLKQFNLLKEDGYYEDLSLLRLLFDNGTGNVKLYFIDVWKSIGGKKRKPLFIPQDDDAPLFVWKYCAKRNSKE